MSQRRPVLVFGSSTMLGALAAHLRISPLLQVVELRACDEVAFQGEIQANVVVVDAAQITPEQFSIIIAACVTPNPVILSVDPVTYQLTVLSAPGSSSPLADTARVICILSFALPPD